MGVYIRDIQVEYEGTGQKAVHVLAGFTFIEQLTGPATKLALLPNTEHFL